MELSELVELHYITHIDNLSSILTHGILCHRDAKQLEHVSVADMDIQTRRDNKKVPGGSPLHYYANLYINGRNPMLYRNCQEHSFSKLCVIRVSKEVLSLPSVVIADHNAAANITRFHKSPDGLKNIQSELVFAEYWTDADPIVAARKKLAICAEVLVPSKVNATYIEGIYVASTTVKDVLGENGLATPIQVNPRLFFIR